jgi:hypothetical protein
MSVSIASENITLSVVHVCRFIHESVVELSAVDRYIRCGLKRCLPTSHRQKMQRRLLLHRRRFPSASPTRRPVCNERNEKNKLCNGHLKQLKTAGEPRKFICAVTTCCQVSFCAVRFYMGPPMGHVRDPDKQKRFVEAELSALLQAAGGTLPGHQEK